MNEQLVCYNLELKPEDGIDPVVIKAPRIFYPIVEKEGTTKMKAAELLLLLSRTNKAK